MKISESGQQPTKFSDFSSNDRGTSGWGFFELLTQVNWQMLTLGK